MHICDEAGAELPPGEPGLVYFEQAQQTWEYHDEPEKTRGTRHPQHDNWAALGDVGYVDEEGYLFLTDRRAFTIISGGVNIYPAEIESCLVVHPNVLDAAVFGLPDPEMGEYVHAVVQLDAGRRARHRSWPSGCASTSTPTSPATRCRASSTSAPSCPRSANGKLYKSRCATSTCRRSRSDRPRSLCGMSLELDETSSLDGLVCAHAGTRGCPPLT